MLNKTKNSPATQTHSHKIRTFFAAIFGIIAVGLILGSVTAIWLNRTLTNTNTYVSTVAPLVTKPAIQNFVASNVATQLTDNAPIQDLATNLLPASELNGSQTPNQLKALVQPVIERDVLQIVSSPSFAALWKSTNQSAHASLVAELNSNSNELTLDLSPAINSVIAQLKASQLSSVANNITISPGTGKLDIKSGGINRAHQAYKDFQDGTLAIIIAALLAIVLSVWLSVHHAKTARRILFGTGILALFQALVLEAPAVVKLHTSNQAAFDAARAVAQALLHNLQLASLILGVVCLAAAIGSKLFVKYKR